MARLAARRCDDTEGRYRIVLGPLATVAVIAICTLWAAPAEAGDAAAARLAEEVHSKGWIVYSSRSVAGDWDLFLCRPDGSDVRNLTRTRDANEAAPQFSRDGRKLLYRRLPREETISGNAYGTQGELVLANADGTSPVVFGGAGEYPWASWSPDGEQLACLTITGVALVDVASRRVVRTLGRRGFFQQMTWSPDGRWLSGVANAFGTSWSVARMDVATGAAAGVSRVDCCTPDWFPDSRSLIFSYRPTGQRENHGDGWTQLWMADLDGKSRRLVYGEDGRHVYGGCVSPDGQYVIFTGNMNEDGDPGHAGAPMGLVRLADAPIIDGESRDLRKLHPGAKSGPVLQALPAGWEPCWTFAEVGGPSSQAKLASPAEDVAALSEEVRTRGWIAFSAPSANGDWDLFVMRPDGSNRRNLTSTSETNEAGVRFSPDGKRMLFYRIPRNEAVDNNTYGTYALVIADSEGRDAVSYGRDFPWASWGPDGTRLACLTKKGIQIVNIESRRVIEQRPRKGVIQQLVWSPDGRSFAGTANGLGPFWNIGRMDAATGVLNAVSETPRYNCTPDWMPDSRHILYARGTVPEAGEFAELWLADADGKGRKMLYAEDKRDVYGGSASPDGRYLLFTRSEVDLGKVDDSRTSLAIIRMADTPMVGGDGGRARARYPSAHRGPLLDLSWGWEPHWTYAEIRPK